MQDARRKRIAPRLASCIGYPLFYIIICLYTIRNLCLIVQREYMPCLLCFASLRCSQPLLVFTFLTIPDIATRPHNPYHRCNMYNLKDRHSVAAALAAEGYRVLILQSANQQPAYLFYGCGVSLATFDTDFRIRIEQQPRSVASLIVSYLRCK